MNKKPIEESKRDLTPVKRIIKEFIEDADCGIFFSKNTVGDFMTTIYTDSSAGITIDICYGWRYFEIFGLTEEEEEEISVYYYSI